MNFTDILHNLLGLIFAVDVAIRYHQKLVQVAFCDLSHSIWKTCQHFPGVFFCVSTVGNFDISKQNMKILRRIHKRTTIIMHMHVHLVKDKGLITLCVVHSIFFHFPPFSFAFLDFSRDFTFFFDANILVSKMRVKMRKKT